jgi:hypothetical protein
MIKKCKEALGRLRKRFAILRKEMDRKYNKGKYFFVCDQGHIIDKENPWQCKECTNPPIYIDDYQ